jgi:hypothetical protein
MHSGGWSHGGGFHGGGFRSGGFRGGFHHHFVGAPFAFAGFGLGLALGSSFYDPWYYGGPYYGYYAPYPYPPPAYYDDYPPPYGEAAPPPAASSQAPAACGSWVWDSVKQAYHWDPC